jgi:hypothetical protein
MCDALIFTEQSCRSGHGLERRYAQTIPRERIPQKFEGFAVMAGHGSASSSRTGRITQQEEPARSPVCIDGSYRIRMQRHKPPAFLPSRCTEAVNTLIGFRCNISARSVSEMLESWSEWQDLNLRPPRPERVGPLELTVRVADRRGVGEGRLYLVGSGITIAAPPLRIPNHRGSHGSINA